MKMQLSFVSIALLAAGCATDPQPAPATVAAPAPAAGAAPAVVVETPPPPPPAVTTVENAYDRAKIRHVAFKQVSLDDLAETVAVSDVRRSKTNDGYDKVQVFLKNYAVDRVRIRYRFNWTNNDGVVVVDPDHDAWENLTIDAGDDVTLTTIAPTKDCYDFKLRMKRFQ